MACYSPLKGFKNSNGALVFKRSQHTIGKMEVACGQCLGCRLDKSLMWAMRIVHESHLHKHTNGNCFVTFTYRSEKECTDEQFKNHYYVPEDYSLNYHHFRDFIKRLRRHFNPTDEDGELKKPYQTIRYFHCGEYGDENLRPHYHACLFNIEFDDVHVYSQQEGLTTYESETLQKLWPYGFCTIGELNFETASYTAGYILKKITGNEALETYLRSDDYGVAYWVKPPYITMSLKPGIGSEFYEKYKTDFFPSDESPVPGKGIIKKVPRYYETILQHSDPSMHEMVKNLRQEWIAKHREDFEPERLHDKYKCARARLSNRKRAL